MFSLSRNSIGFYSTDRARIKRLCLHFGTHISHSASLTFILPFQKFWCPDWMLGWNNPLPIGWSGGSLGGGIKKGLASRFHSRGPELPIHGPGSDQHIVSMNSRELETSKLATTRILISRLASFIFCHLPSLTSKMAPSLSLRDISVRKIPRDKGSDISPTPPTVDLHKEIGGRKELGRWF